MIEKFYCGCRAEVIIDFDRIDDNVLVIPVGTENDAPIQEVICSNCTGGKVVVVYHHLL